MCISHSSQNNYDNLIEDKLIILTSDLINAAPCMPQNIRAILACQSTVLNITWQQSGEATFYRAMVETSAGQVMFPITDKPFFSVPNILCGLTYNVTVVAQNDKCNSSRSSVQSAISGEYTAIVTVHLLQWGYLCWFRVQTLLEYHISVFVFWKTTYITDLHW